MRAWCNNVFGFVVTRSGLRACVGIVIVSHPKKDMRFVRGQSAAGCCDGKFPWVLLAVGRPRGGHIVIQVSHCQNSYTCSHSINNVSKNLATRCPKYASS